MSRLARFSGSGIVPLACALWSISLVAFGVIALSDNVHAELMLLCRSDPGPLFAEGLSYLHFYYSTLDLATFAGGVTLMLVAMMTPALAGPLLHLWFRSLSRHRWRAIMLFFLGYLGVWLAACVLLFVIALLLVSLTGSEPVAGAVAVLGWLIWQLSTVRSRCLARCHQRPRLSVFGMAALVDPLCFGATHGFWCVMTCWALMLIPLCLPFAHLPVMLGGAILIAYERVGANGLGFSRVKGAIRRGLAPRSTTIKPRLAAAPANSRPRP
jgi:predicted metal-binding membrane protein